MTEAEINAILESEGLGEDLPEIGSVISLADAGLEEDYEPVFGAGDGHGIHEILDWMLDGQGQDNLDY